MVKVNYSSRFIADLDFLLSDEWDNRTLKYLMYIKASSLSHHKSHNLILQEDFSQALNGKLTENQLLASFKTAPLPNFLIKETNKISKYIRFAIHLTEEYPYKTIILTTQKKHSDYIKNTHLKGITSVLVKSGDDAREIVNSFFKRFAEKRDMFR